MSYYAYVEGAHRAMVHRSHSGRYGIVNSEEGYQNLRRFLFGDLRIAVDLVGVDPPDGGDDVKWQLEAALSIREWTPGDEHALLGPEAQVRLTVTTRNIDEPDV
jgi:hypothetical protein